VATKGVGLEAEKEEALGSWKRTALGGRHSVVLFFEAENVRPGLSIKKSCA